MKNLIKKVFLGMVAFVMITCISYTKPVYATTTNDSQTKSTNDYKWVNDLYDNLYDNLFKIVFGEDYDINEVTYNYKTQTYHYEDETVTEEQLGWLVYYCVYSK